MTTFKEYIEGEFPYDKAIAAKIAMSTKLAILIADEVIEVDPNAFYQISVNEDADPGYDVEEQLEFIGDAEEYLLADGFTEDDLRRIVKSAYDV